MSTTKTAKGAGSTCIRVTRATHDRLVPLFEKKGDTFEDIIRRLLDRDTATMKAIQSGDKNQIRQALDPKPGEGDQG